MPNLHKLYYGRPDEARNYSAFDLRWRLHEEQELFSCAERLLRTLENVSAGHYPQLLDALNHLRSRQAERLLMEAWCQWHNDTGRPEEAAKALEEFLHHPDAGLICQPHDSDNCVLLYAAHLLTALLGNELPVFRFGSEKPLPRRWRETLLDSYLNEYELLRKARVSFSRGKSQNVADEARELAETLTCPWSRPLAYELWVDVVVSSEHRTAHKNLFNILTSWVRLWPDHNPMGIARQLEEDGLSTRSGRIRWYLGLLAHVTYLYRGKKANATKILELLEPEERERTERPGLYGLTLQQFFTFLQGPGNEQSYLILDLNHADENQVETWIKTYDPYAKWGACPKAVLIPERTLFTKEYEEIEHSLDSLLAHLRDKLSSNQQWVGTRTDEFRRTDLRGESITDPLSWISLRPSLEDNTFQALAFAVEPERNTRKRSLRWMCHTLVLLDPVDPTAVYGQVRDAIRLVNSEKPDLETLRKEIVRDIDNAMLDLSEPGKSNA